jgi:hypothetical protein
MDRVQAKIQCERKLGPLVISFDFMSKCKGDLVCHIDKDLNPSEDQNLWSIPMVEGKKVVIYPKVAYF